MFLYMAARAQLVEEVIRPALDSGKTVVSDRYLLANVVYQGHAGGLDVWTRSGKMGYTATDHLAPDLTIVLDLPSEAAAARLSGELDRMEKQGPEFHSRGSAGIPRGSGTASPHRGRRRQPGHRRSGGRYPGCRSSRNGESRSLKHPRFENASDPLK